MWLIHNNTQKQQYTKNNNTQQQQKQAIDIDGYKDSTASSGRQPLKSAHGLIVNFFKFAPVDLVAALHSCASQPGANMSIPDLRCLECERTLALLGLEARQV